MATKEKVCIDPHCAAHNHIMVRGRHFTGVILESKAQKTATVEWTTRRYIPKFERFEVRRSRLHVHNPDCIDAKPGDIVELGETRKISKTKSFVILKKVGQSLEELEKAKARYEVLDRKQAKSEEESQ